jgi:hypothetical protein
MQICDIKVIPFTLKLGVYIGEKDWEPKSHNQTCHACGKEYYLD